jgi:hypothetical protein
MMLRVTHHYARLRARIAGAGRAQPRAPIDRARANAAAARAIAGATLVRERSDRTDDVRIPVIVCSWDRAERIPRMLRGLAHSVGVKADVYVWNNRAESHGALVSSLSDMAGPMPRTTIAASELNIGGFGRFYWARELAQRYPFVVFVDDDQLLDPFALRDLVAESRPGTIRSVWAFTFSNRVEYWHRTQVAPGALAKYAGTGGMIADSSIFTDDALFECPASGWFMEDLWLSHYAHTVRGWPLYRSAAEIGMIFDGKDQYANLKHAKNRFFRELNRDGTWADVPAIPRQTRRSAVGAAIAPATSVTPELADTRTPGPGSR